MARFCTNCGAALPQGAAFCPACGTASVPGAPASPATSPLPPAGGDVPISPNITLYQDGKYRWVYELNLLKNPSIFLLVWRIFFFIFIGIFIFVTIADSGRSGFWWGGFLDNLKIFGYILLGMTGVTLLGYLLYAAIMGGKYCVIFEMDDKGVSHKQVPTQAKKARKLASLTTAAGAASGNFSVMGAGIGAARTEMYSDFASVGKVRAYPSRRVIKLRSGLNHNQVYAAAEDFEFVRSFILARCPKLKR